MPEIRPFPGLVFDPARSGPIARNLAEPYDKVTEARRERYLAASPTNIVGVDLPREERPGLDRYAVAAETFRGWIQSGILKRGAEPAFYLYDQGYEQNGERRTRRAFFGLVEAREYGEGAVLRHERTFAEPKADRSAHLRALHANLSAVFLLYRQAQRESIAALEEHARGVPPLFELALEDGTTHKLTAVTAPEAIARCRDAMRDTTCVIADGHHRYETSVAFRHEQEDLSDMLPGFRYVLAAFVETQDPGLTVLPSHRLLPPGLTAEYVADRASRYFDVEAIDAGAGSLVEAAERALGRASRPTFVAIDPERAYKLSLRPDAILDDSLASLPSAVRTLEVAILHALLLERALGLPPSDKEKTLGYARTAREALEAVESGRHGAACLLNAASPSEVIEVARAGATMPQKSTDFYPKMLSGLLLADLTQI